MSPLPGVLPSLAVEPQPAPTRSGRAPTLEQPAAPTSPLTGRSLPVYVALTLAAVAGNYFATPLVFGLDFVFGSIFSLLVVQLYGPAWGTASAAIAASYTYFLWGQPWAAAVLTAEAAVVGLLAPRLRQNVLLADGLFWLLVGMPLIALFYGGVMETGPAPTLLVMLKQSVNGICNALVASLLLTHTRLRSLAGAGARANVPLRQVVFELLVAAALLPLLVMVVAGTRQDLHKLEGDLLARLDQTTDSLASRIGNWRERHVRAIAMLGQSAGESHLPLVELQREVELLHRSSPELGTVYVADAGGTITAIDPRFDADGLFQLGTSIIDRPWLVAVRTTQRPVVSNVHRGRRGRREPIVAIAAPVMRAGSFSGFAVGTLDLKRMHGLLALYAPTPASSLTLADDHGVVIASTMPSLLPLAPYHSGGDVRRLGHGRYHRFPEPASESAINRWRTSLYGREVEIGEPLAVGPWHLRVELPVAPLQQFLQVRYLQAFAGMLVVCVLALLGSAAASSLLARPLARLAEATTGLPERLASGELPAWPRSRVTEVDSLARNFRRTAGALEERFHELTSTSKALRERSVELAAANRELQSEVGERRRAEWALRLLAESGSALAASRTADDARARCPRLCPGSRRLDGRPARYGAARRRGWPSPTGRGRSSRDCSSGRGRRRRCSSMRTASISRCCCPIRWSGRPPVATAWAPCCGTSAAAARCCCRYGRAARPSAPWCWCAAAGTASIARRWASPRSSRAAPPSPSTTLRSMPSCARPTAARTSSWPCSPTSCAIRWRRSATRAATCCARQATTRADAAGAGDDRAPGRATWRGWSTTCSTSRASRRGQDRAAPRARSTLGGVVAQRGRDHAAR